MNKIFFGLIMLAGLVVAWPTQAAVANPLEARVNEAFRGAFGGRNPNKAENDYWRARVARGEKTTFVSLQGAMFYHKALGQTMDEAGVSSTKSAAKSSGPTTNKQQLIVDVLSLFEQYIGNNPTATEKAWWRKRISCGEIKSENDLVNSMKYHKAKNVRKGKDTICGQASSAPAGVTRKSVAGFSDHPLGDTVRIGIYNAGKEAVVVTANGKYQVREGNEVKATLGAGDEVKVTYSNNTYHVRGAVSIDGPSPIRLVPVGGTIMEVNSFSDPSVSYPGKNYNRFRGTIEVRKCSGCGEVWVINDLRVEDYAKGLGETLASDPGAKEYYKALATAARSYALYHRNVTGGRKPAQGYDIGSTAYDQIYRGYEFEKIVPRLVEAVDATRGVIVTNGSGDKPLITTYFSDTGGKTKTAKEVWGTTDPKFAHLQKSVDDPHHVGSSCRGHCVGLSAQGAFGLAKKDGWSFAKILQYYYHGVRLVKAY